jgi:TPR repeat protein
LNCAVTGNLTEKKVANVRGLLPLLILTFSLAASGASFAQTYEQGRAAYKEDDFKTAFAIFQPLANQGHAQAQFSLAILYDEGEGVQKDIQKAAFWYRKAAEQGHRDAQFNLGQLYSVGKGVPKDLQQAYFWWILASTDGDEEATENRDKAERALPPEQREKAREEARKWRATAPR